MPPAVARETPKARQDAFRDLFLEQVDGKLVEEKPVTMGTMAGKEYTASTPTGMARFRVLGTGVQIFLVLFSGTKEQLESKEIVAFFDSFRRKPPEASAPQPGGTTPGGTPAPAQPGVVPPPPKLSAPNESMKGDLKIVDGLKVTPVKIRANVLDCMFWADANGTAFWALDGSGTIFRISFPDLVVRQKIELGRKCCWLAPSAEGLIVTVEETEELWVLDPAKGTVKKTFKVPLIRHASSAPNLSVAFAHHRGDHGWNGDDVMQIDLKTGAISKLDRRPWNPTVSPDGKYLFVRMGDCVERYILRDGKPVYEQTLRASH